MRIDQIALLMGAGDIIAADIHAAPLKPGKWQIDFSRKGGERLPLTAQRGNTREFSSIDSAWKVLSELGMASATIHRAT